MSVLLLVILAIAGGVATSVVAGRRRTAFAVGLATAVAALIAATSIGAEDTVPLAGSVIGGSDGLRTLAIAWAASTLLVGLIEGLLGHGPEVLGPSLIGLGLGAMSLAVADAGIGFALLTGGAVVATAVPLARLRPGSNQPTAVGVRLVRPQLAAGFLSLLAVAWGASPVGPFAAADPLGAVDPALETAMGVGLVVVISAVLIRFGAIPAHAWAARFAEAMPASAVPPVLGWGAAAFGLIALSWVDVTLSAANADLSDARTIVAMVGATSIVLGGIAAILHDDIEHVLAYSIVQDAGVTLFAFASSRPDAASAGRDWILAAVAVKAAFAAWVLVTRATFGGAHRLTELRGWARRSPLLGGALALVTVGAVGVPGMSGFDARARLVDVALPAPFDIVALVAAFAPVAFLGRILLAGVGPMSDPVRMAVRATAHLDWVRSDGWARAASPWLAIPSAVRANRYPLAAATAILASVVGLAAATGGLGSTAVALGNDGTIGNPTPGGVSAEP